MRTPYPLLACLLLAGCVRAVSVQRLDPAERAPTEPERVEVLPALPSRPHAVIAYLRTEEEGLDENRVEVTRRLLRAAAKLGADAVVLDFSTDPGTPRQLPLNAGASIPIATTNTKGTAAAIVWLP